MLYLVMKHPPLALCALLATTASNPAADYSALLPALEEDIRREMSDLELGGIAVALVDDQRIVYAAGFGEAKRDSVFGSAASPSCSMPLPSCSKLKPANWLWTRRSPRKCCLSTRFRERRRSL